MKLFDYFARFGASIFLCGSLMVMPGCGGGGGSGVADSNAVPVTPTNPTTSSFRINVTVAGLLSGRHVVLQNNGAGSLVVNSNGGVIFDSSPEARGTYSITVQTQPIGQVCLVERGTGEARATVIAVDVSVFCSSNLYTVGVTVNGLLPGNSVTVADAAAGEIAVTSSNMAQVNLPKGIASGTSYNLSVATQPSGQNCIVTNGSGVVSNTNISNISVTCTGAPYRVGSVVTGLSSPNSVILSLVTQGQTADVKIDSSSNGIVTNFPGYFVNGTSFVASVSTQPGNSQTCSLENGAGVVAGSDVTNIVVKCVPSVLGSTVIGGVVSGVPVGSTLVLQDANMGTLSLNASYNGASWKFPSGIYNGKSYHVTVGSQPYGAVCTVQNGAGTVAGAEVSNILVRCVAGFRIAATVNGLQKGKAVTLQEKIADHVVVNSSGNGILTYFPVSVPPGSSYSVTLAGQPKGQTCTLTNGIGVIGKNDILNVAVSCAVNNYLAEVTVVGLKQPGNLTVQVRWPDGFSSLSFSSGDTVLTQPVGGRTADGASYYYPLASETIYRAQITSHESAQSCAVTAPIDGIGTIIDSNVSIVVTCQ